MQHLRQDITQYELSQSNNSPWARPAALDLPRRFPLDPMRAFRPQPRTGTFSLYPAQSMASLHSAQRAASSVLCPPKIGTAAFFSKAAVPVSGASAAAEYLFNHPGWFPKTVRGGFFCSFEKNQFSFWTNPKKLCNKK